MARGMKCIFPRVTASDRWSVEQLAASIEQRLADVERLDDAMFGAHVEVVEARLRTTTPCPSIELFCNDVMEEAASCGQLDIVQYVATHGATAFDDAMYLAASKGRHAIVTYLASQHTISITCINLAMSRAARLGHLKVVATLLAAGAATLDRAIIMAARADSRKALRTANTLFRYRSSAKSLFARWRERTEEVTYAPGGAAYLRDMAAFEAFCGTLSSVAAKRQRCS